MLIVHRREAWVISSGVRAATLMRFIPFLLFSFLLLATCAGQSDPAPNRWWKGNLHTHSLWSDGDDFPEMIAEWYKQHGDDLRV